MACGEQLDFPVQTPSSGPRGDLPGRGLNLGDARGRPLGRRDQRALPGLAWLLTTLLPPLAAPLTLGLTAAPSPVNWASGPCRPH